MRTRVLTVTPGISTCPSTCVPLDTPTKTYGVSTVHPTIIGCTP